jgi:hypothetical protein
MPVSHVGQRVGSLDALFLTLMAAGGPDTVTLTDTGALHRLLATATDDPETRAWLPQVGHSPDPLLTRRVAGLDRAVLALATTGRLQPTPGGWCLSSAGQATAERLLRDADARVEDAIRVLAARWRWLALAETRRRDRGLQVAHPGE